MRRINTSAIPAGLGAPVKTGTLEFIFDSHKETVASVIKGALQGAYLTNTPYILWGCDLGLSGGHSTNTAGAIFMNDEVFLIDSGTSPTVGAWDGMKIVTTDYTTNADPVTFSDGSTTGSIHNIRKMAMQQGGSPPYGMPVNSPLKFTTSTTSATTINVSFLNDTYTDLTAVSGSALTINLSSVKAVNGTTAWLNWRASDFNAGITFVPSSGSAVIVFDNTVGSTAHTYFEIKYVKIGATEKFIIKKYDNN